MTDPKAADLLTLTAGIASAYVGNNRVPMDDLPALLRSIHTALGNAGVPVAMVVSEVPVTKATAAQIRKSVTPDALISFEDGKSYRTLKRHLTTRGMTVAEYKAKWGLPADYPMSAPAYSEARSAMAKSAGLGKGGRKAKRS